jgi:ABC-type phosphate transport system permease subunit
MSAPLAPSMSDVLTATVLALSVSVVAAVGVSLLLQQAPPGLTSLVRRVLGVAAGVPKVVLAAGMLTVLPLAGTTSPRPVLTVLLAAMVAPGLVARCDDIFSRMTSPLREAAAALGAGALSATATLVLPVARPALTGAVLAAGAQGIGALLTIGTLQGAAGARPDPLVTAAGRDAVGLGPVVLLAGTVTLVVSTLVGIYVEDFSENAQGTRHVDRLVRWLSALPPLVSALVLAAVISPMRHTPPDAGMAALLLALLLGPHAALAVRSALSTVPVTLRQASRALGASRRQTLRRLVLPAAARPLIRRLCGAVTRATLEWFPFVAIGIALILPEALPAWVRALGDRWMTVPGVPVQHLLAVPPSALPAVPPVVWLLAGLTTVATWLTPAADVVREPRL